MQRVHEAVCERLQKPLTPDLVYFTLLSVFHEDMHGEAFIYTRQTHGYPAPALRFSEEVVVADGTFPLAGDVEIPGTTFQLGATPDEPFVFDNEKRAHPVEVRPFVISRAPVTQAEFLQFYQQGGYRRPELWSDAGWQWRQSAGARRPLYWTPEPPWQRRHFDQWVPLEPHRPVIHVNWYEADAYCRWAKRRLPTEAEWELAAASPGKRRFPWGSSFPTIHQANLGAAAGGCVDVGWGPAGDSVFGCRQMIGNVWEWCADDFQPYPGFVADPYKEYSEPWFGTHKVLRGGCWVTRARLIRNTWRNFYTPDRRDVWAGFRTCKP
jgi:iron(II)-dependent oxidoreductase